MEDIKELLLQERLSVQRTNLANQATFLSFLRTSLYFLVAGLSVKNLLQLKDDNVFHISFYIISGSIFIIGMWNYFRQFKRIKMSRDKIRECRTEMKNGEQDSNT